MRLLLALILSALPLFAAAEEKICPQPDSQPWDKIDERQFSKESGLKQLASLAKYFNGEIKVADEFLYQSFVNLEGSYLRNEMENWKNDPKNYEYYKEKFCEFISKRAYLVH